MHDDVCIVMNEREPAKKKVALELVESLKSIGLHGERLPPQKEIIKLVALRKPNILVLDYLLGDFGTALDLLTELSPLIRTGRLNVILWTDERSVSVAVNAMKSGATDYIELDSLNSMGKLLRTIQSLLTVKRRDSRANSQKINRIKTRSLGVSPSFQKTIRGLQSIVNRNLPAIILEGPPGAGRNSFAYELHLMREKHGEFFELDLRFDREPFAKIFPQEDGSAAGLLSYNSTVLLDHSELGEDKLRTALGKINWNNPGTFNGCLLILGTTSSQLARSLNQQFGLHCEKIPSLSERIEDFSVLSRHFSRIAEASFHTNRLKLTPAVVKYLAHTDWPENIREFKSVLIEALSLPKEMINFESASAFPIADNEQLEKAERIVLNLIFEAKQRYERVMVDNEISIRAPQMAFL